ncbi:hypothetical protein D9M68_780080 [compost metagenome]
MDRCRSQATQGLQMHRGGIALMPGNAIAGILCIQQLHLAIPADLGQNRCGGDRRHLTIALDHSRARHLQARATIAVDQRQPGGDTQAFHGALHRQHGGMEDIQAIDLLHLGPGDAPGQRFLADLVEEFLATRLSELLRIVQAENRSQRIENHRRRHYRAAQRATTDLIDAGHQLLHQTEIQPQLHQPRPASASTASAACTEASQRRVR